MNILLILAHQRKGSFCHAIAETAADELRASGHEVLFHDLYQERFDPILADAEIPKGSPMDSVVALHCRELTAADGYLVVHPNWWAQPPAILKGWLDRVLRQGVAYEFGPQGVIGLLRGKTATVFTTSNTPREDELKLFGDPLDNLWKACVFQFCGLQDVYRRNFESIILSTPQQRAGWLDEVRATVRKRFAAGR
ncbi:MAG: NAD(P)H-dependent oxidoreductase [Thermoguttaceae bacterium]|jgi:putative NADPH-quinone reductase